MTKQLTPLRRKDQATGYQAEEIRKRYAAGEYQVPLAKEYGVSQRVISLIVRGESYKCM